MNYATLLFALLTVVACKGGPEGAAAAAGSAPAPVAVTQPWSVAVDEYLALRDALVAGDWPTAEAAADDLQAAVAGADVGAMGDYHGPWMDYAVPLGRGAREVAIAGNLEDARAAFAELTPAMVAAVRTFGKGGRHLYLQHCPMAFDNEGADWVSDETEIRNPYFGAAMPTCGKVVEEL